MEDATEPKQSYRCVSLVIWRWKFIESLLPIPRQVCHARFYNKHSIIRTVREKSGHMGRVAGQPEGNRINSYTKTTVYVINYKDTLYSHTLLNLLLQ